MSDQELSSLEQLEFIRLRAKTCTNLSFLKHTIPNMVQDYDLMQEEMIRFKDVLLTVRNRIAYLEAHPEAVDESDSKESS